MNLRNHDGTTMGLMIRRLGWACHSECATRPSWKNALAEILGQVKLGLCDPIGLFFENRLGSVIGEIVTISQCQFLGSQAHLRSKT